MATNALGTQAQTETRQNSVSEKSSKSRATDNAPVMTYAAAAKLLTGSVPVVRQLVKDGKLVAFRVPGRTRSLGIVRSSLDALLAYNGKAVAK